MLADVPGAGYGGAAVHVGGSHVSRYQVPEGWSSRHGADQRSVRLSVSEKNPEKPWHVMEL